MSFAGDGHAAAAVDNDPAAVASVEAMMTAVGTPSPQGLSHAAIGRPA